MRLCDTPAMSSTAVVFPEDWVWGAATAAYQIEGAVREGGRGRVDLGPVQPYRRHHRQWRHGRSCLRSLPSLPRGHRAHARARPRRLSLLHRLAAHLSHRERSSQRGRSRLLPSPRRRAARGRDHALRHPLPLGSAAGAAGPRWLGQSRHRAPVRRLHADGRGRARLRSSALVHDQRALGRRIPRPLDGSARPRQARFPSGAAGRAHPVARARRRDGRAALRDGRVRPGGHRAQPGAVPTRGGHERRSRGRRPRWTGS